MNCQPENFNINHEALHQIHQLKAQPAVLRWNDEQTGFLKALIFVYIITFQLKNPNNAVRLELPRFRAFFPNKTLCTGKSDML